MKKLFTILLVFALSVSANQVFSNNYQIDHASLDAMFEKAELVEINSIGNDFAGINLGSEAQFQEKDPLVAFLLSWFLGPLGIHRAYLGTSTGTIIGYILTGGGCGIVVTIDWVMLLIGLINNDIEKYVDNPKFFMW